MPHFFSLAGCQSIMHIYQPLGLHKQQASFDGYLDEIPFAKSNLIAQGFRKHYLAALPHSAYCAATAVTISHSKPTPASKLARPSRSSLPWARLSLSVRRKTGAP